MTCAELTTAFEANKKEAKAVYATLKAARGTCKNGNATRTRFARESHSAIAALSCTELEDEISTLKVQASAAGLSFEASTGGENTGGDGTGDGGGTTATATTAPGGDESGASAAAAGVSALVAVAFAQLA